MPPKGSKTKKRATNSNASSNGRKRKQREEEKDEKPAEAWCWCKRPQNGENMLACDTCKEWFHQSCLQLTDAEFAQKQGEELWYCPDCSGEPRPVPKRGKPTKREPEPEPEEEQEEEHQQPQADEEHEASEQDEPQEEEEERQQTKTQPRAEYQAQQVQVQVKGRNGAASAGYAAAREPVAHAPHDSFTPATVPVANSGSTSPPAPSPYTGFGGTATSPAAVQASMQAICATPGCTNEARMGPCPMCVQMGLPPTYFCSQDCFDRGWSTHCATAHIQRVGIPMANKPTAAVTPPSAQSTPAPIQPNATSPTGAATQPPSPQAGMGVPSQPAVKYESPASQPQQASAPSHHPSHNYPQHQQPHHGQHQGYPYQQSYPYPPQQYPPPPQYSHQSYPNHPNQHMSHPNTMHPQHQTQHQQHPSPLYPPHQYQQQTRPMAPGYANYPLQHNAPYPYSGSTGHMPSPMTPAYPYHMKPSMNAVAGTMGMSGQDPSHPAGYQMPGPTPGFESVPGSETHSEAPPQSEVPASTETPAQPQDTSTESTGVTESAPIETVADAPGGPVA